MFYKFLSSVVNGLSAFLSFFKTPRLSDTKESSKVEPEASKDIKDIEEPESAFLNVMNLVNQALKEPGQGLKRYNINIKSNRSTIGDLTNAKIKGDWNKFNKVNNSHIVGDRNTVKLLSSDSIVTGDWNIIEFAEEGATIKGDRNTVRFKSGNINMLGDWNRM